MAPSSQEDDLAKEEGGQSYVRLRDPSDYATKDERDAEADFLAPARWWFITTLFPLFAGTFGPVATAFSICALTQDWRIVANPSSDEQEGYGLSDPSWLIAINAVSLAVAVCTNLIMLAQMMEKLSYKIAGPVVVLGWYISSFLLIGLVAAAYNQIPIGAGVTASQAFYYACMAAAIYFLVASMLLATAFGVFKGQYAKKFKLTTAQRTLMLQTIIFLGYVLAMAAVYSRIEGWTYLDAVYWTIVTLFTIGFGDYAPKTHLGRGLLFPAAIGGILFVGLIIGSIRTLVLQGGSMKISRRTLERTREQALATLDHEGGTIRVGLFHKHSTGRHLTTQLEMRRHEFELMRKVRLQSRRVNQGIALLISGGAWLFLWLVGAAVFYAAEKGTGDWSYFESLYFAYVSFLTIGYGDFEPGNQASKPAFVMWALLALPTLTLLIGAIGDNLSDLVNSTALKIAENPRLKNTSLGRGAIKAKKGPNTKHHSIKPHGFMEVGHKGVDHSKFEDKDHADIAHAVARDFHHPKDADEDHPEHDEVQQHRAKARRYRGVLLFKAVSTVTQSLDASPPRKFTYEEWAWMLKLLGEDEGDSSNHRELHQIHQEDEHHGEGTGIGQAAGNNGEKRVPWSWLGPRSPLMSSTDESKWLLERLMAALEKELWSKEQELERREVADEKANGEEVEDVVSLRDGFRPPSSLDETSPEAEEKEKDE